MKLVRIASLILPMLSFGLQAQAQSIGAISLDWKVLERETTRSFDGGKSKAPSMYASAQYCTTHKTVTRCQILGSSDTGNTANGTLRGGGGKYAHTGPKQIEVDAVKVTYDKVEAAWAQNQVEIEEALRKQFRTKARARRNPRLSTFEVDQEVKEEWDKAWYGPKGLAANEGYMQVAFIQKYNPGAFSSWRHSPAGCFKLGLGDLASVSDKGLHNVGVVGNDKWRGRACNAVKKPSGSYATRKKDGTWEGAAGGNAWGQVQLEVITGGTFIADNEYEEAGPGTATFEKAADAILPAPGAVEDLDTATKNPLEKYRVVETLRADSSPEAAAITTAVVKTLPETTTVATVTTETGESAR